ncbi:unnamed protein product [Spirodela intermedia]|uniref:Uncharacterized protein n=1 Tax=Spirodela intermedia TaxID=51605 RepID=A0A7I8LAA7_SPIIN|nr:unnamed protein product [Spirodela intermedia]
MGLASRSCVNAECGATAAGEWGKGWALRSGGFANLCGNCGMAYEKFIFCDLFHGKESGWRECSSCGKRLHCGCVASRSLIVLLDNGGVQCVNCAKNSDLNSVRFSCILCMIHAGRSIDCKGQSSMLLVHRDNLNGSYKHIKREEVMLSVGDLGITSFPDINQVGNSSSQTWRRDDRKYVVTDKRSFNPTNPGCLGISLGTSSNPAHMADACDYGGNSHLSLPMSNLGAEGREQTRSQSALQQVQKGQQVHPKPLKSSLLFGSETSKESISNMRVARPPGEGRGRNHLLPRYWPRITDQELKQISGGSNSTIVPLFEKVLSASDAGRIGRLVLPKACAEAYFPPISQPEGLPLRIQDSKGKDWIFQFRFWPNNNSRMYVLEGVTPCIQSMQLQAGDTVTFSRIDPEGKLVMGFRKAINSVPLQDSQISAIANGNESFLSGVIESLPIVSCYSGLLQSLEATACPQSSGLPAHRILADGVSICLVSDNLASRLIQGLPLQPLLVPEKKRSRNISSKSKRLHIDSEDALELKLTWEDAQDLLRAPPNAIPSIVVIEDHEFEEYEEPPVLGKKTIFTIRASGGNDQWVQCDHCHKWRRLPADAIVLSKWVCTDNAWDPKRSSCSAPDEMGEKEIQNLLQLNAELKKRKLSTGYTQPAEEPAGLEALATLAVLGNEATQAALSVATATTKHPRHRPGCSCIVCIQPPSGKGPKHKPTCTCNVCMTVRRRFKTLMMRKKKRQSEQEAGAHKKLLSDKDDAELGSSSKAGGLPSGTDPLEASESRYNPVAADMGTGQIDLNCRPERGDGGGDSGGGGRAGQTHMSMMTLLKVANLPLEMYLKQNGLTSLVSEQPASSSSHAAVPWAVAESEEGTAEGGHQATTTGEDCTMADEGDSALGPLA